MIIFTFANKTTNRIRTFIFWILNNTMTKNIIMNTFSTNTFYSPTLICIQIPIMTCTTCWTSLSTTNKFLLIRWISRNFLFFKRKWFIYIFQLIPLKSIFFFCYLLIDCAVLSLIIMSNESMIIKKLMFLI